MRAGHPMFEIRPPTLKLTPATGFLKEHGERRGNVSEVCEMSENHWNLSS